MLSLRLGATSEGLREENIKKLITGRSSAYTSINELRDVGLPEAALEKLADADAFRSLTWTGAKHCGKSQQRTVHRPSFLLNLPPMLKVSTSSSL